MAPLTKLLLLAMTLAALTAIVLAQTDTCHRETCVDKGALCDPDDCEVANHTTCDRQCRSGLVCTGPTGYATCQIDSEGSACDRDADCHVTGFQPFMACIYGKCQPAATGDGLDNDECTSSDWCDSGLPCVQGKCVGFEEGATCSNSDECKASMFCNSNVCTKLPIVDEACPSSACYGSACNRGKCTPYASIEAGGDCDSTAVCKNGLYCDAVENQCTEQKDSSLASCSVDSDCDADEECMCNTNTGEMSCVQTSLDEAPSCSDLIASFYKCLADNSCHLQSNFYNPYSCFQRHCGDELSSYSLCLSSSYDILKSSSCKSPAAALVAGLAALF